MHLFYDVHGSNVRQDLDVNRQSWITRCKKEDSRLMLLFKRPAQLPHHYDKNKKILKEKIILIIYHYDS